MTVDMQLHYHLHQAEVVLPWQEVAKLARVMILAARGCLAPLHRLRELVRVLIV